MILGRPTQFWYALVSTIAAAIVATAAAAGIAVNLEMVAADLAVAPVSDPSQVSDMQKMSRAAFLLAFKDDPRCNGAAILKRAFEAALIEKPEELLLPAPPPNPAIIAKAAELKMKELEIRADASRQKAAEVRDYAQALFFLAQAKKMEGDQTLAWLDMQMSVIQQRFETATALWERGQIPGAPGTVPPNAQPDAGDAGEAGAAA